MAGRLEGKVAVVTGASSGIGKAILERFVEEGADVIGVSRSPDKLEDVRASVAEAPGKCTVVAADLATESGAETTIQAAVETYGGLDILVNNAGIGYSARAVLPQSMNTLTETPTEDWDTVMSINLGSVVRCSRLAIPVMQERGGGSIINIASILGLVGHPDAHAYTTAKGGIINLTRSLGHTYGRDGIRTNVICPGYIDTPLIAEYVDALNDEDYRFQWNPMGRVGYPVEIAHGAVYLASDEASYCNASTLTIDGGYINVS